MDIPNSERPALPQEPAIEADLRRLPASELRCAWKKAKKEATQIFDAIGTRVDRRIRETVGALHLFGISTESSCEGHAHRPYAFPYVWTGSCTWEVKQKYEGARRRGVIPPEVNDEIQRVKERDRAEQCRVRDWLDEFYRTREVPYSLRLVVDESGRLINQGAESQDRLQDVLDEEDELGARVLEQNLREFQREMRAFTAFLRQKFLSDPGSACLAEVERLLRG